MSAQVYSVPVHTEGRKKAFCFFGMEKHRLMLQTISCMGRVVGRVDNVNYYKSVHHVIPTCGNKEHPGNFQNKSVSSPFN